MREVDDDNDPPTCERCHCEYTMDHGDEPTRFCDACAHHVAESSADALELLEKLRAHPVFASMVANFLAEESAARALSDARTRVWFGPLSADARAQHGRFAEGYALLVRLLTTEARDGCGSRLAAALDGEVKP